MADRFYEARQIIKRAFTTFDRSRGVSPWAFGIAVLDQIDERVGIVAHFRAGHVDPSRVTDEGRPVGMEQAGMLVMDILYRATPELLAKAEKAYLSKKGAKSDG